jgi:hypothetical protein
VTGDAGMGSCAICKGNSNVIVNKYISHAGIDGFKPLTNNGEDERPLANQKWPVRKGFACALMLACSVVLSTVPYIKPRY